MVRSARWLLFILTLIPQLIWAQTPIPAQVTLDTKDVSPVITVDATLPNGEAVVLNAVVIDADTETAQAAAKVILETQMSQNNDLMILSDLPAEVALAGVDLRTASKPARRLGLFEIHGETTGAKLRTVMFITAQTALNTFAYVVLSGWSPETAWLASALSGALNFYFGADPERWPRILDWAQNHYRKGTMKMGRLNGPRVTSTVEAIGPLQTSFAWSTGIGLILTGLSSWTNFAATFLSLDVVTRVLTNSALAAATTGTWEALFKKWKADPRNPLSDKEILFSKRLRSLVNAMLVPMAQSGLAIGSFGVSLMATVGITAFLTDLTPARVRFHAILRAVFDTPQAISSLFRRSRPPVMCRALFGVGL